ncbi:MAG: hypothetical protein A2X55_09090 [Nitrospirae bacterium GWB2_47_37]|nr:MAG: hypothetical protein A2Z82_02590 [Nitrospirae bacterium GWA2_46_11]OGW23119.1 MAG: hypothetical protein A2X55_09090 [Nitrospirae bacterium GWB2_47_37]HAK87666.1 hypothetical protein [Nitrospiraceae bacterium]
MKRRRICDCAEEVLRETDNPAVGFGDSGLLHRVAERAGLPHEAWKTEERVLNALSRTPGNLVLKYYRSRWGQAARVFYLKERAHEHGK